jgi:hypothetical protein
MNKVKSQSFLLGGCVKLKHDSNTAKLRQTLITEFHPKQMFNLELGGNGDTHTVTPELINQSIEALDEKQQDFIKKCLEKDPARRPCAKELLFHPLLFEVPSLRLLAAHQIIKIQNDCGETNTERIFNDSDFRRGPDYVIASTNRHFNSSGEEACRSEASSCSRDR